MENEVKPTKRTVLAPRNAGAVTGGQVLSVEVEADEDVEWAWSHDRDGGSTVTGYRIVSRVAENAPGI